MIESEVFDELHFIKKIVEDSRRSLIDNGMGYIVWGIIVFWGLIGNYTFHILKVSFYSYYSWMALIAAGWLWTYFYYKDRISKHRARTFAGKLNSSIWLSAGIAMTIIGFAGVHSGAVRGMFVSALISVVLGIAYFLSGIVNDYKPLKYVALGWWAGALLMMYVPKLNGALVMAVMMLFLQILPGIVIYKKSKNAGAVR